MNFNLFISHKLIQFLQMLAKYSESKKEKWMKYGPCLWGAHSLLKEKYYKNIYGKQHKKPLVRTKVLKAQQDLSKGHWSLYLLLFWFQSSCLTLFGKPAPRWSPCFHPCLPLVYSQHNGWKLLSKIY